MRIHSDMPLSEELQEELRNIEGLLIHWGLSSLSHLPVTCVHAPFLHPGIVGDYGEGSIRLAVTRPPGSRTAGQTLLHELGHHYWHTQLKPYQKIAWRQWFYAECRPLPYRKLKNMCVLHQLGTAEDLHQALTILDPTLARRLSCFLKLQGHTFPCLLPALDVLVPCPQVFFKHAFTPRCLPWPGAYPVQQLAGEAFADAFLHLLDRRWLPRPVAREMRMLVPEAQSQPLARSIPRRHPLPPRNSDEAQ